MTGVTARPVTRPIHGTCVRKGLEPRAGSPLKLGLWRLCLTGLCLLAACQRPAATPPTFLLPAAYNLTGSDEVNWISRALPALLAESLDQIPGARVQRVDRYQDAAGHPPGALLACRYEPGPGGKIRIRCSRDGSDLMVAAETGPDGPWGRVAQEIGRQIDSRAGQVADVPSAALRAFSEGRYLDAAAAARGFSPVYEEGVGTLAARGDQEAVRELLALAETQSNRLRPATAARLDLARAAIKGDLAGQAAALARLDSVAAPDPARLSQLGSVLISLRRIPDAIAVQERLTVLTPNQPDAWNQLGYFRAAAGNLAGARAALEQYRSLMPDSPNPLDSLGEVHFQAGEFTAAERYFRDAYAKNRDFNGGQALIKAAFAQRARGDRAGAQATIRQAAERRPDATLLLAQWDYSGGDREAAIAALESALPSAPAANQPAIAIQLALWRFVSGDTRAAVQLLSRAQTASGITGTMRLNALFASFLTQPDAPAAVWEARAAEALPGPGLEELRVVLVSLALITRQRGSEALPALESRFKVTSPLNDTRVRVLLAESLRQAGKADAARSYLVPRVIPILVTGDSFASILLAMEHDLRRKLLPATAAAAPKGG